MPIIGAHVTGGIKGGVARALEIQAQALQIFVGSPQSWRPPNPSPAEVERFRASVAEHGLGPVFVHALYLVNLAAQKADVYEKSVEALANQLSWVDAVGAQGLIFHPGSAGTGSLEEARERVVLALEQVLDSYPGESKLLLETCAGQGATIGRRFADLAGILAALSFDARLGICVDTCHVFNAGYDLTTPEGLEAMVQELDDTVGLDRLCAIHANDSKTPLGAQVDRHENIGQGKIGEAAFARMLQHPAFADQPFILEVPGYDGAGPDLRNVQTLRRLAEPS
ncbi:MAG: deoxyribonuclease IV [Chloroflexi bacterium]|nr:deoxyribonuclease IV [Chloroflexota bacterium]